MAADTVCKLSEQLLTHLIHHILLHISQNVTVSKLKGLPSSLPDGPKAAITHTFQVETLTYERRRSRRTSHTLIC